jgi:LPXTG-site transpeptidase (sortase) family protein
MTLPTVLLVAGALLLSMSSGSLQIDNLDEQVPINSDSALGLNDSRQFSETSLVHSAPINYEEADSQFGHPIRVNIQALSVQSRVMPVSSYGGVMEIPEDISRVGWYVGGSSPGDAEGSAVLVGHRDGVGSGRGAFYGIENLEMGDHISVISSEGFRLTYAVVEVEVVDKDSIENIAASIFTKSGEPRLTLITCGGAYVKDDGGYDSNVIVTALPQ